MSKELERYKRLVDGLVDLSGSVTAKRVRSGAGLHTGLPNNALYNELISSLTEKQRDLVAELLDDSRSSGIHDFFVFLDSGGYQLETEGIRIPQNPFGTELCFDYISRKEGDPWPDEV